MDSIRKYEKNKYELYFQIWYTHSVEGKLLVDPHIFWLYYGRFKTYDGALESLRTNRPSLSRWEGMEIGIGKIRNADNGSVSFF